MDFATLVIIGIKGSMAKNVSLAFQAIFVLLFITGLILCDLSSSPAVQSKGQRQMLSFQRAHVVQVHSGQQKQIQINLKELSIYITHQNEQQVMSNFLLQYKSVVRSAKIHFSLSTKQQHKDQTITQNFTLFDHSEFQQLTVFELKFLAQFKISHIQRIVICISSDKFSVVSVALLNNQIPFQVDLTKQVQNQSELFGLIPVWIPFSYDTETEKVKQIIKYVYFRAGETATKLRITRVKGHPKVFLYNCQTDRLKFCKDQIRDQHVEGTLMFQKQILVSLTKENNCIDCLILLGFKNMGAETQVQITEHKSQENFVISKDEPIFYDMKRNSSLEIISYYNLQLIQDRNKFFLDFSFVETNSSSIKLQVISMVEMTNFKENFSSKDFLLENRTNALRLKLNPDIFTNRQVDETDTQKQIWYKITIKIVSKTHSYFSIVDRNIPNGEQNFITLKDGQIFHSYIFNDINSDHTDPQSHEVFEVQNFKVKTLSISTLTVITFCKEFNRLQIQFYSDPSKITKISPKVYVENITNHNKKCSQLIHFNPSVLFSKGGWVYVKLTGIKDEVEMLYSSSDMIMLENGFPFHSQIQYNQPLYFYAPYVKSKAIIKISKCSDCQISVSYSEEQLADLKAKRSQQMFTKEVNHINAFVTYQMKEKNGLYIKLNTNNYAHFVITIEQAERQTDSQLINSQQVNNQITFSLEDDDKLILQFSPPEFLYTNNLNSPIYFNLIEGSIQAQVSRQVYCPEFIFTQKEKTRDVSITQIAPQLNHDQKGNQKMRFVMQLKHHDFFGIRAQKGDQIFSYQVVNIESMKEFAQYRLSIFNVILFLTFALFMSFVCFMGLKRKRIRKIGGQVVLEQTDGEETSMIRLN